VTRAPRSADRRAQTVLLAATVIALAMVPLAVAYLQLGAHPDAAAGEPQPDGARTAAALDRALTDAVAGVPANYSWASRDDAAVAVRERLAPAIDRLETAGVEEGVARLIAYNDTAARRWASANCPRGPDRQFGDCETSGGLVLQERVGETHVLAAAFDVRVTTDRGTTRVTVVVEVAG
jgi:hypothetical protein